MTGHDGLEKNPASHSVKLDLDHKTNDFKDKEILRLQRTLTEANTMNRARESQLRVAKEGLKNAREALNETFSEYASVREELSTVKQVLGRDHQAILYRKDIELFALRKMNEQREKSLVERETKLKEMECQHKAAMELKEEQIKRLKDRLTIIELQSASHQDTEDGEQALEVRLLKVKKGRKSFELEDEKDNLISQLQDHLAVAEKSAEAVVNKQAELQRAWDITKKIQDALKEERDRHTQTREQLQGVMAKLSDESKHGHNLANSSCRLPTIEEDERDRSELEAMFEVAQEDNAHLKSKVVLLEKRLQDANAKLFSTAQEAEALREQVRFEQNCKADMENARASVIHHVHLQHMEDQIRDLQDELGAKDEEIRRHKKSIAEIDRYVGRLRREIDAAMGYHTEDQDEIERLKGTIAELQSTKRQLMADHEQRAAGRTRPRPTAANQPSAQPSGAPIMNKPNPRFGESIDASKTSPAGALPPVVVATTPRLSGQSASHHKGRRGSANGEVASKSYPKTEDEIPVDSREEKTSRRTSLGLRDMMRRIARKDHDELTSTNTDTFDHDQINDPERSGRKSFPNSKVSKTTSRPDTVGASTIVEPRMLVARNAVPAITSVPHKTQPSNLRRASMKYYTTASDADERPSTAASKDPSASKRRSWGGNVQQVHAAQ